MKEIKEFDNFKCQAITQVMKVSKRINWFQFDFIFELFKTFIQEKLEQRDKELIEKIEKIIKAEYKDWGNIDCDRKEQGGAKCGLTELLNKIQILRNKII